MLLLKEDRTFQQVLQNAFLPLVILPATDKAQANDLALDARIAGMGVTVVKSRAGELFVLASDSESQTIGFARGKLRDSKTGQPWFLLLRDDSLMVRENQDRTRDDCSLTENGWVVGDNHVVDVDAVYVPAQRNSAWLHSLGHNVGEHL